MVVVALGEPGTPVTVCARDGIAARTNATPHRALVMTRRTLIILPSSLHYFVGEVAAPARYAAGVTGSTIHNFL